MEYFDYNATAPLTDEAREAWLKASDTCWQNPSSPYASAAKVHVLLEEVRGDISAVLRCAPSHIVFNSGATEGNNSIFSYMHSVLPSDKKVLVSAVEHPSVLNAARHYFADRVIEMQTSDDGTISVEELENILENGNVGFVSVMAANNESGVIMPWQAIADTCKNQAVPFHCDAVQWVGRYESFALSKCDFVTASAHKFGGPKGVGFVKISENFSGYHSFIGGAQEYNHRAGTENYPSIVAMMASLKLAEQKRKSVDSLLAHRNNFISEIKQLIPAVKIVGESVERLWNTVLLIMPEHENSRWVLRLDKEGVSVSTGSACATAKEGPSYVLTAQGYSEEESRRAVRISAGHFTSENSWKELLRAFEKVNNYLNDESNSSKSNVISI